MARKAATVTPESTAIELAPAVIAESRQALATVNAQVTDLATQLGYEGSLTVGALEDEIRFYQRRTVEALLETGKRLMLLKELTPHGEFAQRVEMLGISMRSAQRFMQAAQKTAKSATVALLATQVKSQKAFLELVTHDDDDLKALAELDDIDRMSASELRTALRDAAADLEARGRVLADKDAKINDLSEKLSKSKKRVKATEPADVGTEIRKETAQAAAEAEVLIRALNAGFTALAEHTEAHGISHDDFMAGLLGQLQLALHDLRSEFDIKSAPDGDPTPEWMRPGAAAGSDAALTSLMERNGWTRNAEGHLVPAGA